jgi:hypothetical protein
VLADVIEFVEIDPRARRSLAAVGRVGLLVDLTEALIRSCAKGVSIVCGVSRAARRC